MRCNDESLKRHTGTAGSKDFADAAGIANPALSASTAVIRIGPEFGRSAPERWQPRRPHQVKAKSLRLNTATIY